MNPHTTTDPAEHIDRHIQSYAGVALLLAQKFAISAAIVVAEEPVRGLLDVAETIVALTAVALVIVVVTTHWRKLPAEQRRAYLAGEGFVPEAFRRATSQAFFITLLVTALTVPFSRGLSPEFTGTFFLNASLAFMLLTLSVGFFARLRNV